MRYISTRGGMQPRPFREILLEGLATDGGLVLPESYPRYTAADLARLRVLNYRDLAFDILSRYIDDIAAADLKRLIDATYTPAVFGSDDITPLKTLEPGLHLLQLANGPTLAFKDVALQLLGNLFEYVLAQSKGELNILGATSGDTGSAAEYAMRGKRGMRVFMLSPHGKMSRFQTAQMYSLQNPNIFNIAIRGVFDDCQDIVKQVSNDEAFKRRYHIGTVNSINWARVAAQIVYYFKGYFAATKSDSEQVSFAVPSGNFGNILAGHIARMMGLPVRRLICATNENNVLDEFFRSGRYRPRASSEVLQTSSPSMDISKASNFERFMFDVVGRDASKLRALWQNVDRGGTFDIGETVLAEIEQTFGFVSGASSHADRLATLRDIYQHYGVMIDTHTADGVKVGLAHREPGVPLICLETAQAIKFSDALREAIGTVPPMPAAFQAMESLPQRVEVMAVDTQAVKDYVAARCGDAVQANATSAAPTTILLVEDNAVNQVVATALLNKLGCNVTPARNGAEAVEAVKDQHFDLVLMDCNMPVMDGFEATAAIRKLESAGQARHVIVAQTGNAEEGDREGCIAAGMDDYVAKPLTADQLAVVIARWKKFN